MIQFDSFMISKGSNRIILSANLTIVFDSATQENYAPGYPSFWDEYLLSKIAIENYDIVQLFAHIIPKNERSRISDYKKVWGLSGITKGLFDLSYSTDSQSVYLGMTRAYGEEGFRDNSSSLLLLLPKNLQFDGSMLLQLFAQHRCCFTANEISTVISDMCQQIPNAVGLWYNITESAILTIFGNDVSALFLDKDLSVLENIPANVSPAFRMPFCNLLHRTGDGSLS